MTPDTSSWSPAGEVRGARYYWIRPNVLACVPDEGAVETAESSARHIAFQREHLGGRGGGIVFVFADNIASQDAAARAVYRNHPAPKYPFAAVMISSSLLGRAIASFFLGLSRSAMDITMVADLEGAMRIAVQKGFIPRDEP